MSYVDTAIVGNKEVITLWGREYEVIARWKCAPVPADYVLPNGRLDLSKYEPLKNPLARAAAGLEPLSVD